MAQSVEHPIFLESIDRVRALLGETGLDDWQQRVLERLVHSSGDPSLAASLQFTLGACERGVKALRAGAGLLVDTAMAAAAVTPMAARTINCSVQCVLDWAPEEPPLGSTRTAFGMELAWRELSFQSPPPLVLIGSAPTALQRLLDLVADGGFAPSLIIGMPVGFVGVPESKQRLAQSAVPHIRLDGSRGGAGLVGAAANALLKLAEEQDHLPSS